MRIVVDLQAAQDISARHGSDFERLVASLVGCAGEHDIVLVMNARLPRVEELRITFSTWLPASKLRCWRVPEGTPRDIVERVREAHIAALHPDVVFTGGFAADDAITSIAAFDAQTPVVAWLDADASPFSHVLEHAAACVIAPGVEVSLDSVPGRC